MKIKILIILLITYGTSFASGWKIFVPKNNSFFAVEIKVEEETMTSVCDYLGYNSDQFYVFTNYDIKDSKIDYIIFKVFTNDIICVLTQDTVNHISKNDVDNYLVNFNLKNEFDSYDIENTLNDGIKNKSLTTKFLAEVLNLDTPEPNGMMYVPSIGYKIEFNQGIIKKFYSSDGLNKWAKGWKINQPELFKSYENAARKYLGDKAIKIINEINTQANAFVKIPEGFQNEYLKYHRSKESTINFKMLLVAHYNEIITLQEFKEINYGRYKLSNEFNTPEGYKRTTYKLNKTLYTFSENGKLVNSYTSE